MFAGGEEDLQMNSSGETKGSPFELESESSKWNLWELNKACILLMTNQLSFPFKTLFDDGRQPVFMLHFFAAVIHCLSSDHVHTDAQADAEGQ